jgi:hypothetical protein
MTNNIRGADDGGPHAPEDGRSPEHLRRHVSRSKAPESIVLSAKSQETINSLACEIDFCEID